MASRREYQKQWRQNNKDKVKLYRLNYRRKHPDKIREKDKRRRARENRKLWTKNYNKKRLNNPLEKLRHNIRVRTRKIYGRVPSGYQRHHLDYLSPHNFILVTIVEHRQIHNQINCKEVRGNG